MKAGKNLWEIDRYSKGNQKITSLSSWPNFDAFIFNREFVLECVYVCVCISQTFLQTTHTLIHRHGHIVVDICTSNAYMVGLACVQLDRYVFFSNVSSQYYCARKMSFAYININFSWWAHLKCWCMSISKRCNLSISRLWDVTMSYDNYTISILERTSDRTCVHMVCLWMTS